MKEQKKTPLKVGLSKKKGKEDKKIEDAPDEEKLG